MSVIDEIIVIDEVDRQLQIDRVNDKTLDEIIITDKSYHFAKQKDVNGVNSVTCDNAVNEPFRSIEVVGNTTQVLLPSYYQQVQYIQSDGNCYIDTGVTPNIWTGVDIIFMSSNVTGSQYVFGTRRSIGNGRVDFAIGGSGSNTKWAAYLEGNANITTFNRVNNHKVQCSIIADKTILRNKTITFTDLTDNVTETYEVNQAIDPYTSAWLFGYNGQGYSMSTADQKLKIFACKMYSYDELIRDFIPCYRKADGVIGFYDLVNRDFYTNGGTGTFTKGADYTPSPTPDAPIDIVNAGDNRLNLEIEINSENLLNLKELAKNPMFSGSVSVSEDSSIFTINYEGAAPFQKIVRDYCPTLKVGDRARLDFTTTSHEKSIILTAANIEWKSEQVITITEDVLDSAFMFLCFSQPSASTTYYNLQIVKIDTIADISIPTIVGDLKLRFAKFDDTNKDSLIVDGVNKKVIYKQMLDKYTITGDETFIKYVFLNTNGVYFSALKYICNNQKGFCTHLESARIGPNRHASNEIWIGVNNNYYIYWTSILDTLGFTTKDEFAIWCKEQMTNGTPVEILFVMPTAQIKEHDITDTEIGQQLLALAANKGTNILTITSNLPVSQINLSYWRQIIPNEPLESEI